MVAGAAVEDVVSFYSLSLHAACARRQECPCHTGAAAGMDTRPRALWGHRNSAFFEVLLPRPRAALRLPWAMVRPPPWSMDGDQGRHFQRPPSLHMRPGACGLRGVLMRRMKGERNRLRVAALKGRYIPAQGTALGKGRERRLALKGRDIVFE